LGKSNLGIGIYKKGLLKKFWLEDRFLGVSVVSDVSVAIYSHKETRSLKVSVF